MLHNAEFVISSRDLRRKSVKRYERDNSPSSILMEKIVRNLGYTNRLIISNNKYYYKPSEEYLRFVAQFRRKKY